jgi:glycosyltransferase involved in cell wall biosynthesis
VINIYDCSNSDERPQNRGNGGPVQNDVMRYLKENAHSYGCQFVDHGHHSLIDLVITNDVFPEHILKIYNGPKLKRMDGVFFQEKYKERNIPLNRAAQQADHVIFISEFSKQSYFDLYGDPLKSCSVALNQVDPSIFKCLHSNPRDWGGKLNFATSANDWSRKEKRLHDILAFANVIDGILFIFGTMPKGVNLPDNVTTWGYKSDPKIMCELLSYADAFVNFSYKDAAPKTVLQALCCGLPVLYADSGGLRELVDPPYGVAIPDAHRNKVDKTYIPPLVSDPTPCAFRYDAFKHHYPEMKANVLKRNNKKLFKDMLDHYFFHIRRLVDDN